MQDQTLSHAISLPPHPYLVLSHAPEAHSKPDGASTAVEPTTPPLDAHEPVARHLSTLVHVTTDVEDQRSPPYDRETDPFQLSRRLKSPREIDQLRANISRKRTGGCGPLRTRNDTSSQARKLRVFYETQNSNIERLLRPVDEHRRAARDAEGEHELRVAIAVRGSFAANVVLAGLQTYAAASSGSLSLFATMADAVFDPLSNLMLILCARAVNRVDPRKFPSGKARIETSGNIVFCFLMCAVSFILIVLSARDLAVGSEAATKTFHLPAVVSVAIAFATKLVLFLYCGALRTQHSQVRILWQDHRNDLLINGLGLMTSIGGSRLRWWLDPAGALALSVLISGLWLRTAWAEFQLLIGVSADPQTLQLITYICEF